MRKVINTKKVAVAEDKKSFTQLLKEAENEQTTILIFRRGRFAEAILPPDEYKRIERLVAYFEALQTSKQLARLPVSAAELAREARQELEDRD